MSGCAGSPHEIGVRRQTVETHRNLLRVDLQSGLDVEEVEKIDLPVTLLEAASVANRLPAVAVVVEVVAENVPGQLSG